MFSIRDRLKKPVLFLIPVSIVEVVVVAAVVFDVAEIGDEIMVLHSCIKYTFSRFGSSTSVH